MRRILLLSISLWLSYQAYAQTDSTKVALDSTMSPKDSVSVKVTEQDTVEKEKEVFFQASINADYGKLATTIAGWDEKYEAGVSLLFFNQYYLLGEYGQGVLEPENAFKNGVYTSEGSYYRLGGGYLKQISPKSKLGIGVLYASSMFEHRGAIFLSSPSGVQDDYTNTFQEDNLSARWLEVMVTSESKLILNKDNPEAKINRLFTLGFYLRARFLSTYDRFEIYDVYTIPGYGRTVNNPNMALNLFLKVYVF